ncbi:MAG: hypothetical protein IJN77_07420 [Oscillospiraceae bacterium]|nr:hypothetical protein [Oscillospiraceae bacterium]
MKKQEIIQMFENNYEQIKDMVFRSAIHRVKPSAEVCRPIEKALSILAEAGNKEAAVLYGAVAAYDYNDHTFDKEKAAKLLFNNNATEEYYFFIEEEFRDDVDWEFNEALNEELKAFPLIYFCEEVIGREEER